METSEYESMFSLEDTYWWYKGLHALVSQILVRLNVKGPLLDAGCGTGRLLEILQTRWDAEGFDRSPDAVRFCQKRRIKNVREDDLNSVELPVGHYGAIVSMDVLYIREIPDDRKVLNKFFEALRPGGVLLLNLPAFEFLRRNHDAVVHTRHRYTRSELKRTLEEIGFTVATAGYRLPHLFLYLVLKKFIEILRGGTPESDLQSLPAPINWALLALHRAENSLATRGVLMPFGSSVFVVATKP